jgi:COX assembly protein 2
MHPPLHFHLHTEDCKKIIEALSRCHVEHPLKKYIGACNDLKRALNRCLQKEYTEKRHLNWVESQKIKEKSKQLD